MDAGKSPERSVLQRGAPKHASSFRRIIDRVRGRFYQWIAQPGVRERLMRLPGGSFAARRQARGLYDLCAGFVYSQVLSVSVSLNLPALVADKPQSLNGLAAATHMPADTLEPILRAAAALGILRRTARGNYGLGMHGASLLADPGIAAMVRHHSLFYRDMSEPLSFFKAGAGEEMSRFWGYSRAADKAGLSTAETRDYSELMAVSQSMVSSEILRAFNFSRSKHVLDVGGGAGVFVEALRGAYPDLALSLFDLPSVAAAASERLHNRPSVDKISCYGGDFLADDLPSTGADTITLVRILHDQDDAQALALLRSVKKALPSGGQVVIAETMGGEGDGDPIGDAYFSIFLIAMGRGRTRSVSQIKQLLAEAGFSLVNDHPTPLPMIVKVLSAR